MDAVTITDAVIYLDVLAIANLVATLVALTVPLAVANLLGDLVSLVIIFAVA